MSGDVQPRKRKDKKRKKDDCTEHIPTQPHTPSSIQSEDINIHVHKEEGTGGGICAKIIFFLLFTALAICIGLIITEHRGLTDLEAAEQESRFSHLFEGWIDNSIGHGDHEDEGDHILSTEDHDEELASHEGHDDEDEEHDDHEEDEHDHDEEEEEEAEAEASEEVAQSEEDEEEEEESEEPVEDSEEPVDESEEAPRTEEDEEEAEDEDEEEENVSELDGANEEASDEIAEDNEEEDEADSKVEEPSVEQADEEDEEVAVSQEEALESEEKQNEELDEEKNDPISREDEEGKDDGQPEDEEQSSKMVVKIGVGVALLVVAHVVLVRKWKSATPLDSSTNEEVPDLSRRNTIVVPPSYQEIKQEIEATEEEFSDEDGEVESDEETDILHSPEKYGELRTTYARSLTPESEPEFQNKTLEPDEEEYEDEEEIEEEEVEEEEEEEEDEDDEELETGYEKDADDDLLKRLERKYGKLQGGNREDGNEEDLEFSSWKRINVTGDNEAEESESDKQSDAETYEYENITNKDDIKIKDEIDEAHKNIQNNTAFAIKLFDVLLQKYPSSPRSLYGKAQALDLLADQKRSNDILQLAISIYLKILTLDNIPNALFEAVAQRCLDRMRFIGNYHGAIDVHFKLLARFPEVIRHKNQLVVTYLTINRVQRARVLLQEILAKHPNDGFALVHYGFIIKTIDNKLNESVSYLQKGIATKDPGVIDGRFYFHLGDALARLGKTKEAMKVYEDGVKNKLFLSKYQRSLYNVDRLKGQPWWKKEETPYLNLYKALESNWRKIREEGISVLNKDGLFQHESENLKDTGDWKQFELFARGKKNINNCNKCPFTCKIIENIPDASGCKRGQTKFSVMHPGTHVWPHCGPTNCRLRVHLGLKVPPNTFIRVADKTRSWEEGKVLIFDDSFEHEVWHNGTSFRLVLIVDVWHPELTSREKRGLSPI